MNLVILKYNAGNIQSVLYALERIGVQAIVTDDQQAIKAADKIIFPGVGEASTAIQYLQERKLDQLIKELKQPVLGICLGMQLMCNYSEENKTPCLNIFDTQVKWFGNQDISVSQGQPVVKIPQIGWNNIDGLKTDLFSGIPEESYVYFVNGYYAELGANTIATANYIKPYSAALNKDNFYGVQFHPEKSAAVGEQILKNFLQL